MSTLLNAIKQTVASSVRVELKPSIVKNNKTRYPLLVTDVSNSVTNGWVLHYDPTLNNGRFYSGAETFKELLIARFSHVSQMILTAHYYFSQGQGVEKLYASNGLRAVYEPDGLIRFTVTSRANSVSVVLTVTDESSPFYMLSVPFTVTSNNGQTYIVGTDKLWDRNTDMHSEGKAAFAPRKSRFHRVRQQQNGPASLIGAKVAVRNGMFAVNQDGSFELDGSSEAEYIQVISSPYKAIAYLYEQAILEHAMEQALTQLPQQQVGVAPAGLGMPMQPQAGFVPSFNIGGQPQQQAQQQVQQPQVAQPYQQQTQQVQQTVQAPASAVGTPASAAPGMDAVGAQNLAFPIASSTDVAPSAQDQSQTHATVAAASTGVASGDTAQVAITNEDLPWAE